ncbi:MAG: arylsulfatase [Xanthobacteraceae bacterium]
MQSNGGTIANRSPSRRKLLLGGTTLAAASVIDGIQAMNTAQAQQPQTSAPANQKPNIIFIMVDDLGNADLGYRGSDIRTPNIDKLATEGVRMESFYGQPVCTPSRACLMTGRYPMRYGLQTLVIFPSHTYGLPTEERTLPQALKDAGYRTLMTGKWHLGHADKKYWPQNRGFDHFYGNVVGEVDYFTRERGGIIDWQRNGTFLKENGYYTTLIGNEAVKLIEEQDASRPFFLYFASLAPHAPFQAPKEGIDRYASIANETRRTYAAMLSELDVQIGRLIAVLEKKGLRENTIILFASDNGGATSGLFATGARSPEERATELSEKLPASNGRFRGGKGSLYEGGVRVPAFANWPGKLKPAIVNDPVHMVDIMPTLLALAGGQGSADRPFDGVDIWPTLAQGKASPHGELLIHIEPIRGTIRKGDWKLVRMATFPGKTELYNLASDPEEKNNLADQHPDIVSQLNARLMAYSQEMKPAEWIKAQPAFVGAQGKTILDPDFDIDDGGLAHEKAVLPP